MSAGFVSRPWWRRFRRKHIAKRVSIFWWFENPEVRT
jgi:hypothetical protein